MKWTEHVRNEEILRRVGEKKGLKVTIWKRKASDWSHHAIRSNVINSDRKESGRKRGKKKIGDAG